MHYFVNSCDLHSLTGLKKKFGEELEKLSFKVLHRRGGKPSD